MNPSVLIVDDSLTVRMDLADAFEAAGMHSVPCATLAQAHEALGEEKVGLVVLDVHLPDGDGVDFLKELRARDRADPPVIMLTADAEVKDRIRALKTGADEYVGKPYNTKYVVTRARELLQSEDEPPRPAATAPATATVLIIDDSATFRQSLSEALEQAGYAVLAAASGKEGFERVTAMRPNAIVVDGMMPGMDGATFIRHIRLDAALRSIPCLLLTASDDGAAQLDALEAGADAFVRKDHDFDVILARLAAVLRHQGAVPAEAVASLAGPRKVLAVDDSATYLHELAAALEGEGYDVATATSGEEAIEVLAVQPVDCILMDVMMPGIGGKEACKRIKEAPTIRETPLILLTALEDRDAMLEGLSAGADDYISKSSEFEVLRARVRAQIRRKQFEDENRNIREQLMRREVEAAEARSARELADARADLVAELERKVEERTRALEAEIVERRHAERMASVGMLSASIAHEINNPLAVVTGNLDIVSMTVDALVDSAERPPPGDTAESLVRRAAEQLASIRAPLADALEAAERVREIVRDLRIFSRSDEGSEPVPVDIHRVLESSIRMASNEVRHRADLLRAFGEVPQVVGSETRLGQVFLNLIVNAAQAIPEGGVGENRITVATSHDGAGRVVVEVRDTGVGIPADKLKRVFDPFFTTKPAGIGTGLGLAICHRIVSELGGDIEVDSTVGSGTTFRVTLRSADTPAAEVAPPPSASRSPAAAPAAGPRRRVLVVDDEASLAKTIENILSPEHEVVVLTSAREALRRIEAGERFDLILSDVMMPDMGGRDLYNRLVELAPAEAAKVVFMTGGAFSSESQAFLHQSGRPVVEKPFKATALRDRVREILG